METGKAPLGSYMKSRVPRNTGVLKRKSGGPSWRVIVHVSILGALCSTQWVPNLVDQSISVVMMVVVIEHLLILGKTLRLHGV